MRGLLSASLLAALAAAPGAATATEARRGALASSPLFADDTDVFSFPSMAPLWAGLLVASQAGPGRTSLGGGVLIGDRVAGGVFVGRGGGADDLARRARVYPDADIVVPDRLLDALLAVQIGLGHTAGLGVGIAHTFDRTTNADAGDNGVVAGGVDVTLSHSFEALDGGRADSSFSLGLSYFRRTERFEVVQQVPVSPTLTVRHRSLWAVAGQWSVGVAAGLRREDLSLSMPAAHRSAEGAAWDLDLEVGPRYQPSEHVALGLSLWLARSSWSVPGLDSPPRRPDQGGETRWTLPGVRAAVEARPLPWLELRLGLAGGRWSVEASDGAGNTADLMGSEVSWTSGIGLLLSDFRLDGVLTQGILQDGPDLVGGTAPGLFSTVSVSYVF